MELIVVRHAIAKERDADRWPDDRERPVTRSGERRFRDVARVLLRVIGPVDGLYTSPLLRARQTAEILRARAGWPEPSECGELEPAVDPMRTVRFLAGLPADGRSAVVGHEPHLHELLSLLLGGVETTVRLEMKKGGAAWLRLSDPPAPGRATLLALLPPRVLIGEKRSRR